MKKLLYIFLSLFWLSIAYAADIDIDSDNNSKVDGAAEALAAGWNADVDAPQKNDLYDYFIIFDTDIDGDFEDETWLTKGIADTNVVVIDQADAASGEYLRLTATGSESRSATETKIDLGLVIGTNVLAEQTVGIADDNLVEVDGTPVDTEVTVWTANGLDSKSEAEFKELYNLEESIDYEAYDATITKSGAAETLTGDWVNTDYPWLDAEVNNAQTLYSIDLQIHTGAPTPEAGDTYLVDGSIYDPANLGISKNYRTIYDGSSHVAQVDEDGDRYASTSQTAVNVITSAIAIELTAGQMNSIIRMTGAGDVTIPADMCDTITGQWLIVKATAIQANSIASADALDLFTLFDGTSTGAGDELDLGGAAGNQCAIVCTAINTWEVYGEKGVCADGGAT